GRPGARNHQAGRCQTRRNCQTQDLGREGRTLRRRIGEDRSRRASRRGPPSRLRQVQLPGKGRAPEHEVCEDAQQARRQGPAEEGLTKWISVRLVLRLPPLREPHGNRFFSSSIVVSGIGVPEGLWAARSCWLRTTVKPLPTSPRG